MGEKKIEKTLKATLRKEDFGSAGSRRLVRAGFIPAVIYGKSLKHIVLNAREFNYKKHLFSETTLIEVDVEGKTHKVFVKSYQEDLLRGIVRHVDFYEITVGHQVKTRVRVELKGTPVGCKVGGVLDQVMHDVEIECLPKDLPEILVADVSSLDVNESIKIKDLIIPANVKVLSDLSATVATVKTVREKVEVVEEANAEPEVTTSKAPQENN